ncbi:hypothetical protein IPL44_03860 [Candidatus Saccharibacteria bacterium]|nr:MAG: hypothetical protein IPL44_03860 [Candidatus Saccharibacteria bacterium]
MKKDITISYHTYDHNGRDTYSVRRTVDANSGLRESATSVIQESLGKTKYNWLTEVYKDQQIIFFLNNSGHDIYQNFGIQYGINKDGSLKFLTDYSPLRYNWTLSELEELRENGYIDGDLDHITIATPEGLGATGGILPQVLDALIYIGGVYGGIQAIKSPIKAIHGKVVAKKWSKNNLKSLSQIRELLDMKSIWQTSEVKKRLGVKEDLAIRILTKLGYELTGDKWKLGQSDESLALRSAWLAKEVEIENTQNERFSEEVGE